MASIGLHEVTVQFGATVLLNKVSLDVAAGEKLVLVGPSGHGKSIVLKLFAGLMSPTSGSVTTNTEHTGMLFQRNALFDSLTVAENVAFPLRERGEGDIERRVRLGLEHVGLQESAPLYPAAISGGMQKRLGIARALALNPKIVLYDDPTAGLDPVTSRKIVDLILHSQKVGGSTLVVVTNDMVRAFQIADRIVMVVDAELIVTGNREQTLAHRDPRVRQFVRGQIEGPLTEWA